MVFWLTSLISITGQIPFEKEKKIPSRTFSRILGHFMDSLKHLTDSMRCFGYFTKGFVVVVPVVLVEFVSSALLLGFFFLF